MFKMTSQENCPMDRGSVNTFLTGYMSGTSLYQHLELVPAYSFNIYFLMFQLFFSPFPRYFPAPFFKLLTTVFSSSPLPGCSHATFLSGPVIFIYFNSRRDFLDCPIQMSAPSNRNPPTSGKKLQPVAQPKHLVEEKL